MAFTLAYLTTPVPGIPDPAGKPSATPTAGAVNHHPRPPDSREHFGTEQAAMRRAREILPAADWTQLRLYGPDGRLLADQAALAERLGVDNPAVPNTLPTGHTEEQPR